MTVSKFPDLENLEIFLEIIYGIFSRFYQLSKASETAWYLTYKLQFRRLRRLENLEKTIKNLEIKFPDFPEISDFQNFQIWKKLSR